MRAVAGFVVIIVGKKFYLDALRQRCLRERGVAGLRCKVQQKVQAAVFAFYRQGRRCLAGCKVVQQTVALRAVVGAHAVDVALKIAVLDKFGEGELLKVGHGAGIKAQFFIKK